MTTITLFLAIKKKLTPMTNYLAAFLMGIVSAGHCLGMCGGLMLASGLNSSRPFYVVMYNVGRLSTYLILAAIFGFFSSSLPTVSLPFLQILSGILLLLTAIYFAGVSNLIQKVEKLGAPIWQLAKPISRRLLPIDTSSKAYALGLVWGFIPCGLVYTALAFSVSQSSFSISILTMLLFGLGTFPAMITSGLFASQLRTFIYNPIVRRILVSSLVLLTILIWLQALKNLELL